MGAMASLSGKAPPPQFGSFSSLLWKPYEYDKYEIIKQLPGLIKFALK